MKVMKRSFFSSCRGLDLDRRYRSIQAVIALFAVTLILPLTGCGTVRSLSYPGKEGRIAVPGLEGVYKVTRVGKWGSKKNIDYSELKVGDQLKIAQREMKTGGSSFTITHVSGNKYADLKATVMLYRFRNDIFAAARFNTTHDSASLLNAPLYRFMRVQFDNHDASVLRLQAVRMKWVLHNRNRLPGVEVLRINSGASLHGPYIVNGKPAALKKMLLAVESDPGNALEEQDILHLKRVRK